MRFLVFLSLHYAVKLIERRLAIAHYPTTGRYLATMSRLNGINDGHAFFAEVKRPDVVQSPATFGLGECVCTSLQRRAGKYGHHDLNKIAEADCTAASPDQIRVRRCTVRCEGCLKQLQSQCVPRKE